jgi:uncharacterized protein (DUF1778 family)
MARTAAVSVRLKPEDKAALEKRAEADGRTVSQYVEQLILADAKAAKSKLQSKS